MHCTTITLRLFFLNIKRRENVPKRTKSMNANSVLSTVTSLVIALALILFRRYSVSTCLASSGHIYPSLSNIMFWLANTLWTWVCKLNPCFLDLSLHDLIYEFNFSSIDEAPAVDEDEKEDAPGTIYNRFFHFINISINIIFWTSYFFNTILLVIVSVSRSISLRQHS